MEGRKVVGGDDFTVHGGLAVHYAYELLPSMLAPSSFDMRPLI